MAETFSYGKVNLTEKDKEAAKEFQKSLKSAKSTEEATPIAHNLEFQTMRDQGGLARKKKDGGVDKEGKV